MYWLKRILLFIPSLFFLSLFSFFLIHLMPGSPLEANFGMENNHFGFVSQDLLKSYYHFNEPILTRYFLWLKQFSRGDFGYSYYSGELVFHLVKRALPTSLFLGLGSLLILYFIAIPLGAYLATQKKTGPIFFFFFFLFLSSIPSFMIGLGLIMFFKSYFPIQGMTSFHFASLSDKEKILDLLYHATLPILAMVLSRIAPLTLIIRNAFLEEMQQDYLLAAKAKGASDHRLLWLHARKGVFFVFATHLGREIAYVLSGTLLIETLFGISGIGKLAFDSMLRRDYPVMMGIIILLGALQIVGNLISDLLYAFFNPKVRLT